MTAARLSCVLEVYRALAGRVTYEYGAKAPAKPAGQSYQAYLAGIRRLDCSGFVELALGLAGLELHGNSSDMRLSCEARGYHRLETPGNVRFAAEDPGRLFVGFIKPRGAAPGHVWLIYRGHTMESYGGGGVGQRPYNARALSRVAVVYELPTTEAA